MPRFRLANGAWAGSPCRRLPEPRKLGAGLGQADAPALRLHPGVGLKGGSCSPSDDDLGIMQARRDDESSTEARPASQPLRSRHGISEFETGQPGPETIDAPLRL